MRVISRRALKEFWLKHPQAEAPLKAWFAEVEKAAWNTPQDIKERYRSADFLKENKAIFNISQGYRLVAQINYHLKIVSIKFIRTHKDDDKLNQETL